MRQSNRIALKNRFYLLAMAVSLGVGFVPAVLAAPIYSTLGPAGDFDTNASVGIGSLSSDVGAVADSFTSPVTATVGSVTLALSPLAIGGAPDVEVTIRSNTATGPGGVVGRFVPQTIFTGPELATLTATTGIQLDAGTEYWLSITVNGADEVGSWFLNDQGIQSVTANLEASTWTVNAPGTAPAFELNAVPEPGSCGLCVMALVASYLWRRGKGS